MKKRASVALAFAIIASASILNGIARAAQVAATELAPGEETALVHNYCGGCHSDKLMYGGMSVEHFDAAHPDPTLTAMLLSKLTGGHTPADIKAADSAEILKMMEHGAMGAAGDGYRTNQPR